jgi:hypothetical protein
MAIACVYHYDRLYNRFKPCQLIHCEPFRLQTFAH